MKEKYKEYNIYYPEEEIFYEELGEKIINKEYKELEVYKNIGGNTPEQMGGIAYGTAYAISGR